MKRLLLLLSLISTTLWLHGQQTAVVSATYTYFAPESMAVDEAKHIALERAKIEAIASEFGTVVTQSNTVVLSNSNENSETRFYSVGGSDVKGEWIETIGQPQYNITYVKGILTVTVKVKGRIKEIDSTAPEIELKTYRNGVSQNNETSDFLDGDDFFMTVRPSVDGYLVAYLLDETAKKVYRILPYQQDSARNVKLKEGQLYTFFLSEGADELSRALIDTYTMTCQETIEFNRLYVLFSKNPISVTSDEIKQNEELPLEVDEKRFRDWMLRKRSGPGIKTLEQIIKISRK